MATAGLAQAQSEDWSDAGSRTDRSSQGGYPLGSRSSGAFGDDIRGYEYVGPYVQFGASVGEIDFDGRTDVDTGGGFTLTGGYRLLPWLSGEANFSYLGGGDVEGTSREADYFSFTFGPKLYPLGVIEDQPLPEFVQPYGLIAIGGGEYDIERTGLEESTFIARFLIGLDIWIVDQFGLFMEGGYHVASDDDIDGTGLFTFGGQARF